APERRHAEDLRLGGDRCGADDDRGHLRDELRAHAGARLAPRLPGGAGGHPHRLPLPLLALQALRLALKTPASPAGLLGAEQVPRRGDADGKGAGAVARGIRERLQGVPVAEREEVGDDVLRREAEADDALLVLAAQNLRDVGAGPLEELADL